MYGPTMRRKRKRFLLFLLAIVTILILIFSRKAKFLYKALTCNESRGKDMLVLMCAFYENGRTAGNLCDDICKTRLLIIDDCLSHKEENVIFSAKWKGQSVVLKSKKRSSYNDWEEAFPEHLNQNTNELQQSFFIAVYDHVMSQLVNNYKDTQDFKKSLIAQISPSDLLSLLYFNATHESLGRKEMQSLWSLLQQDEFFIMQLLQRLAHVPRIYGTCGQFYVMENVRTLDNYIGLKLLSKTIQWNTSVALALGVMKLVKELDSETNFGPWQLCDIQPSNFGVSRNGIIKTVDVDLMFTNDKILEILGQESTTCSKDEQCDFFDCVSQCNTETKHCSHNKLSNNLQVVCRDLFLSKWIEGGLLTNIPRRSKYKFDKILKECSMWRHIPWTKEKYERIYNTLNAYLIEELHNTHNTD